MSLSRRVLASSLTRLYLVTLTLCLPAMPVLAAILFLRPGYLRDYRSFLRKMRVHIAALREGPAQHYFEDVMGRAASVPQHIEGHCVQCGNCCMERRCVFLEAIEGGRFQCGIYHSPFRKLSNCGSFPLNQWDIDRYACPSYTATVRIPIVPASALAPPPAAGRLPVTRITVENQTDTR